MVRVQSIIFFIFTIIIILQNVLSFEEITTIGDLSRGTVEELKQLMNDSMKFKEKCEKIRDVHINILLYTRKNKDIAINLDLHNPIELQANKKTVMIVHGWLADSNTYTTIELKDEYIKRYDCNVIVVDWSRVSWQRYTTAFCAVSRISYHLTKFLCNLEDRFSGSIKELHTIGHSVGAHILGVVGHYVQNKCHQTIGRITGLDPAGPLFRGIVDWHRLDQSDAVLVDVIHTDEYQFGYNDNMGSIDFHVNCGEPQRGCPSVQSFDSDTNISAVMCSHLRSIEYMKLSIHSETFLATSCIGCPRICQPDNTPHEIYHVMGENCTEAPRYGKRFYLRTAIMHIQGRAIADERPLEDISMEAQVISV